MNNDAPLSLYGFPDAWADFDRRHPQWSAVLSRLWNAMNLAFSRTQVMDSKIEKFVYFYGNLVAEDFMELFLMAANGYGYGAMKLLRSMYEHTVTLKYLQDHPAELQAFFDFDRGGVLALVSSMLFNCAEFYRGIRVSEDQRVTWHPSAGLCKQRTYRIADALLYGYTAVYGVPTDSYLSVLGAVIAYHENGHKSGGHRVRTLTTHGENLNRDS